MKNKILHIRSVLCFALMRMPMPGTWRKIFARLGGINLYGKWYYIGENVIFDSVYPNNITIHNHVHITANTKILTHLLDTKNPDREDIHWIEGHVEICEHAFIGTGSIITGNVRIGKGAIVGAGSVVTKDIPDYEIWGGNPARFIKKRP